MKTNKNTGKGEEGAHPPLCSFVFSSVFIGFLSFWLIFWRAQFFGETEKDGDDEHGEEFDEHAAEDGDGHRDHKIGAATGAGKDRDEGEKRGRRCHETGADAALAGFEGGGSHFGNGGRFQFLELLP